MIEILRCGPLTTVQDGGRTGLRHLGVPAAGALDDWALARLNALLGNAPGAAALELVAGPLELRIEREGWLALCGAPFEMRLDGRLLRPEWRWPCRAGQVLRLDGPVSGQRALLGFAGGLALPAVLGARATDLRSGFGGLQGRALRKGDRLPLGSAAALRDVRGLAAPEWDGRLRALPGPELAALDLRSRDALWSEAWKVEPQSDRMGLRLSGPTLSLRRPLELASTAVLPGTLQLPPAGQPIALLADAGTTGGYPRVAIVIVADLWQLAQARPGARLRLQLCTLEAARAARAQRQHELTLQRRALLD